MKHTTNKIISFGIAYNGTFPYSDITDVNLLVFMGSQNL